MQDYIITDIVCVPESLSLEVKGKASEESFFFKHGSGFRKCEDFDESFLRRQLLKTINYSRMFDGLDKIESLHEFEFKSAYKPFNLAFEKILEGDCGYYEHTIGSACINGGCYEFNSEPRKSPSGELLKRSSSDTLYIHAGYLSGKLDNLLAPTGRKFEELGGYTFSSNKKGFSDALKDLIYGQIRVTQEEIEDKVIVPCLAEATSPDVNMFTFNAIDKYFDTIVFDKKELVVIPDGCRARYYDSTKWLERLQTKMPHNVTLKPILDRNAYKISTKGSSYWFITITRVTEEGVIIEEPALMSFTQGFIFFFERL